ncbi:MAG: AEC family transporter, partial [Roseovarius sp.]|nr:AEC family transporter [Roseovarius sp.]
KSAERMSVAVWLTACKLILHPAFVAFSALFLFHVEPYSAAVMIAAAALPVAGNVYILARHYGVAPQRVSASILLSTGAAVATVSLVIGWVNTLY